MEGWDVGAPGAGSRPEGVASGLPGVPSGHSKGSSLRCQIGSAPSLCPVLMLDRICIWAADPGPEGTRRQLRRAGLGALGPLASPGTAWPCLCLLGPRGCLADDSRVFREHEGLSRDCACGVCSRLGVCSVENTRVFSAETAHVASGPRPFSDPTPLPKAEQSTRIVEPGVGYKSRPVASCGHG